MHAVITEQLAIIMKYTVLCKYTQRCCPPAIRILKE